MNTEAEIKERIRVASLTIPPMTDPMGKHWDQPSRDGIVLDDTHALMTEATFKALHEYSGSVPSGVYPGKMWRCHWAAGDEAVYRRGEISKEQVREAKWLLRWFGDEIPSPDPTRPGRCPMFHKEIVLADDVVDFRAVDWFNVKDYHVATGELPWQLQSPNDAKGRVVKIDGKLHVVQAVELHMHCAPWRAGEPCGLAVVPR